MKKISIVILFIGIFLITGCNDSKSEARKIEVDGKTVDTSEMEHQHCTRNGKIENGTVNLEYDVYYTGDRLNIITSVEQVSSSSSEILDTYENAYKSIHEHYTGLEYYDTEVTRENDKVTSVIKIDYDHIDIGKLIDIEGEEDNIFENKIPKYEKWLELAKKFGTKCETVED